MSGQYKIAWLCEALLVSRSGYYAWIKRRHTQVRANWRTFAYVKRIREEFARSRQTYGSPRLAQVLGCPGRRNRIARLMRLERIFARQRSKYRPLRPTVGTVDRSLPTGYALSWCGDLIKFGSLTSPACSPLKAGYTWSPFWISLAGASSVGP